MTCPICARPSDQKYHPFCSRRCADVDLGKWLTGAYVLPSSPLEEDEVSSNEAAEKPPTQ